MNTGKAPACVPTWRGHIETTKDALLIFEACFLGTLRHCFRRPHDRERNQLIVSGNVFVYEEATSGIKRWTDGIPWSPSRILTNFLIYRQLNSPFPPGEKKRATKRNQRTLKPGEPYPISSNSTPTTDESRPFPPGSPNMKTEETPEKDANRGLVGSLVDSYEFKENGLLKKTMTVTVHNVQHHLVSYYSLEDAKYNLKTPRDDPRLKDLPIRDDLVNQPKFKFPNLDDAGDGTYDQMEGSQASYPAFYPNYDPARMYSPNHGLPAHQVSSPLGFHPGAYAPSHPPSAGSSYASIAPTTSAYAPIASASSQYPQHQPPNQQHPYQHQSQQQAVSQYQGQPQQHSQYQSQQFAVQHHQSQVQQLQHPSYQQQGANALPRRNGMLEYLGPGQGDSALPHDPYSSTGVSGAPQTEGIMSTPQPTPGQGWPMTYPPSWPQRPEGAAYSSYRAQS
ncbi:hypothetical protein MMC28_005717 [Mycoblastus sanguinarius]|nr:hypothetical protein [Mycoblastus sanguinarius]